MEGTLLQGADPLSLSGTIGTSELAEITFLAPEEAAPTKRTMLITLHDPHGDEIATTTQNIVFVPSFARNLGAGKTLWLPNSPELSPALEALGYTLTKSVQTDSLCLATRWSPEMEAFVQSGGKALLLAESLDALQGAEALGIQTHSRDENGWWGDWCGSKNWLNPAAFPLLPDTRRFDFEYQHVTPRFVLTGVPAKQTLAGLYVGWLHQPATTVAQLPLGAGSVVLSTYALSAALAHDPLAALLLSDLVAL
jgi:hypothetical protein